MEEIARVAKDVLFHTANRVYGIASNWSRSAKVRYDGSVQFDSFEGSDRFSAHSKSKKQARAPSGTLWACRIHVLSQHMTTCNIDTFSTLHAVLELTFEAIKTIDIDAPDPPMYRKTKFKVS